MFKFISVPNSIGLERTPDGIQVATLSPKGKTFSLISLETILPDSANVKQLYIGHPFLTTGLPGKAVLIRPLTLPLTKEKDIGEALIFQAEPLLPYSADQAVLAYQIVSKSSDNTDLTLFSVKKDTLLTHIQAWQSEHIEPEKIASVPSALCNFGSAYFPEAKNLLVLHLQNEETTCILIKEGKLWSSFSQSDGLNLLYKTLKGDESLPQNIGEWGGLDRQKNSDFSSAYKKLQKEVVKMVYSLAKECKNGSIDGIIITGPAAKWEGFSQVFVQNLQLPLLHPISADHFSSEDILTYAVPIGLALGSLPNRSDAIDFRQQDAAYPHPWLRLQMPIASYFASVLLLACAFYFFGQQYLHYQESRIKHSYIDLLAGMNKSHQNFEIAFASKNSKSHDSSNDVIPKIESLGQEELVNRLTFLQKELQMNPDSFPLYANIPRVGDVLTWLHQHPAAISIDEDGNRDVKIKIENFNYTMVKRPQQGKKQEKYQIKIELEFSSDTPKLAREFHDALIAPNDWIDPKGEVKWNSNRGKYKTSFFLKDKTVYPSS